MNHVIAKIREKGNASKYRLSYVHQDVYAAFSSLNSVCTVMDDVIQVH